MKRWLIGSLCLATVAGSVVTAKQHEGLSSEQTQQIEKIVHKYIVSNPDVLVEASVALKKQQQDAMSVKATQIIKAKHKEIFEDKTNPAIGNPKGDVTLVEFFDYQCGHCKHVFPVLNNAIKHDKNLRVVFKQLPIFKGSSLTAAKAALAAQKQHKFLKLHDELFSTKSPLSDKHIFDFAKKAGLNTKMLKADMESKAVKSQLDANMKVAQAVLQDTMGYLFTPVIMVSNKDGSKVKFIPGGVTDKQLRTAIKEIRS